MASSFTFVVMVLIISIIGLIFTSVTIYYTVQLRNGVVLTSGQQNALLFLNVFLLILLIIIMIWSIFAMMYAGKSATPSTPGGVPPGGMPPGGVPPGGLPPGAIPYQAGVPPGALPPGALPPGGVPYQAGVPPGAMPPGAPYQQIPLQCQQYASRGSSIPGVPNNIPQPAVNSNQQVGLYQAGNANV